MTVLKYNSAVDRLRKAYRNGKIDEITTDAAGKPRLLTTLTLGGISYAAAPDYAEGVVALAIEVRGYLMMCVHDDAHGQEVTFTLSVGRDVEDEQGVSP